MPKKENFKSSETPLLSFNTHKISNKWKKKSWDIALSFLNFFCRSAFVTSYLCENEGENLQNGDFHLISNFHLRFWLRNKCDIIEMQQCSVFRNNIN